MQDEANISDVLIKHVQTCLAFSGAFTSWPSSSTLVPEGVSAVKPPTASATSKVTNACRKGCDLYSCIQVQAMHADVGI